MFTSPISPLFRVFLRRCYSRSFCFCSIFFKVSTSHQGNPQQAFIASLQKPSPKKQQKCEEFVQQKHSQHTQRGRARSTRAPFWTVSHVFWYKFLACLLSVLCRFFESLPWRPARDFPDSFRGTSINKWSVGSASQVCGISSLRKWPRPPNSNK